MDEVAAAPVGEGPRILDAASVILVDSSTTLPRLLMGLRRPDNVFLPNKWVFPGGRLENDDLVMDPATALRPSEAAPLRHCVAHEDPARFSTALALAAVRELYEETGHALAVSAGPATSMPSAWSAFERLGLRPSLEALRFIARAITPPGRPRRYDTRFFVAARSDVVEGAGAVDGEFTDLNWFTFDEARALDLPVITRRILADLEIVVASREGAVPFYYQDGEVYRRDLIPRPQGLIGGLTGEHP